MTASMTERRTDGLPDNFPAAPTWSASLDCWEPGCAVWEGNRAFEALEETDPRLRVKAVRIDSDDADGAFTSYPAVHVWPENIPEEESLALGSEGALKLARYLAEVFGFTVI